MNEIMSTPNGPENIAYDGRIRSLEVATAKLEVTLQKMDQATELQAQEYSRRLHELNGEYKRDRERQADFVSTDKYEDKIAAMDEARIAAVHSEKEAREQALLRVDEKFEEYVQRWELRQREMDQTINTLSKAAAEAKNIAESQGRQTRAEAEASAQRAKDAAAEATRRQTRNITIMGIILATVVGVANFVPF